MLIRRIVLGLYVVVRITAVLQRCSSIGRRVLYRSQSSAPHLTRVRIQTPPYKVVEKLKQKIIIPAVPSGKRSDKREEWGKSLAWRPNK